MDTVPYQPCERGKLLGHAGPEGASRGTGRATALGQQLHWVCPGMAHGDRVILLVNPVAGPGKGRRLADRLAMALQVHGIQVELVGELFQAAEAAKHLHAAGRLRALVGVGGDGTAAALANATLPGVPLAFFPAGTSNLVAKQLGYSAHVDRFVRGLIAGRQVRLDAGCAGDRLFLAMLGCGFDAAVVHQVHARRATSNSGTISYWSYLKPILHSIRNYEYPEICVELGGLALEQENEPRKVSTGRWVFVFNLPLYGWGLCFARGASARDGWLDLYSFERGGFWAGIRYLTQLQLGWHHRLSRCYWQRVRQVRLWSSGEVPYQLDGDPGGRLPVDVQLLPGRVTVVVPPR